MPKDNWEKADVIGKILLPIIIAFGGWYLSHIYQVEQKELTKAKLETDIVQIAIKGNEQERILAIEFASLIAKKFNDPAFEKIILNISYSDENYDSVRLKAKKRFIKLSIDDPDPKKSEAAKRNLEALLLNEILESADNYFKVEHYRKAATEYEKATAWVPYKASMDLDILEKARKYLDVDDEKASEQYQMFFSPIRKSTINAGETK